MYVGLDFGTTNSSAAIFDGKTIKLFPLDPKHTQQHILPSTLFIPRPSRDARFSQEPIIGQAAIDEFRIRNQGRIVQYQEKYIGSNIVSYADGVIHYNDFLVPVDSSAPGRFFKSIKTELRDISFGETSVFGERYTLASLIAIMLRLIRQRMETFLGKQVTGFVIGCPVRYHEHDDADWIAFDRMRKACIEAQLPNVSFIEEPIAAALCYSLSIDYKQKVLVFDFGGGTLDITVIQLNGQNHFDVLSTEGVQIGGDQFDQHIVMRKLLHHFGEGATYDNKPVPAHIFSHLDSWESMMEFAQSKEHNVLDELYHRTNKKQELRALQSLVRENYGLALYREVEQAKIQLSNEDKSILNVQLGKHINFEQKIARSEFERLLKQERQLIAQSIDRALETAGVLPSDIDMVVRTGGSSRIPSFVRLLEDKFGSTKLKEIDSFLSVAAGLAVAAWNYETNGGFTYRCRTNHDSNKPQSKVAQIESIVDSSSKYTTEQIARSKITKREGTKNYESNTPESPKEGLSQSFHDSRDGSKGLGHMRREYNGRFGSYPMHDDYGDESGPE